MALHNILKILIIDDNRDNAFMLKILMKSIIDFDVQTAYDGRSGIKKVEDFQPEYVILDITLPDMSGEEVAQIIKDKYPEIKIIGASGYSEEDLSIDKKLFSKFWTKPILAEKIKKYFESELSSD